MRWRTIIAIGMSWAVIAPSTVRATTPVQASVPTQVLLAFTNPAPSDPADPCRTGIAFKANQVGDHDDLTACTFDGNGAPVATDASSYRLGWAITGVTSEDPLALRFNPSPPPEETTGAGASAAASIDAVQGGRNLVTVSLLDAAGAVVDTFSVQKDVEQGGCGPQRAASKGSARRGPTTTCPQVSTRLTARAARVFVRGKVESEPECEPGRQVALFLRRRGKDNLIGTDTTGSRGGWRVETGRPDGVYYARVAASDARDDQTGGTIHCLPDQSEDVRG